MRLSDVDRLLAPLRRRIGALMKRGVWLRREADEGLRKGQVSLLANETRRGLEHLEPYGFTSEPLQGAEAFVSAVRGQEDHGLILFVADRRWRLRGLEPGEVALYDDRGSCVILHRDGSIEVRAAGGVDLRADLRVHGDIVADGDVADAAGTLQALRAAYNAHVHPDPQGGSTGPPVPQA